VLGLLRLSRLAGWSELYDRASRVIDGHAVELVRAPHAFPTLLRAVALRARGLSVAVVIGDPEHSATAALALRSRRMLLPDDAVVVVPPGEPAPTGVDPDWISKREPIAGKPTAFVCRGTVCSLPVTDPDELEIMDGLDVG